MGRFWVMIPVSLAWAGAAFFATAGDPLGPMPALALVGSPFVGYGWSWALERRTS
ncbi:MAG: hypothetical protein ACRDGE_08410 [Candidatus Limnocylindria bacterium]